MASETPHIHFKHPTMREGNVHFEDQVYPVHAGVIACPVAIAADGAWPRAVEEEIEAYDELATAGSEPPRDSAGLRTDGPTFEEYTKAGYQAEGYPPRDYAERPSAGLDAFRKAQVKPGASDLLAKILEGTVSDVEAALEAPFEGALLTVEQLGTLAELEATKSNRKGVQAAIVARAEALSLEALKAAGGKATE